MYGSVFAANWIVDWCCYSIAGYSGARDRRGTSVFILQGQLLRIPASPVEVRQSHLAKWSHLRSVLLLYLSALDTCWYGLYIARHWLGAVRIWQILAVVQNIWEQWEYKECFLVVGSVLLLFSYLALASYSLSFLVTFDYGSQEALCASALWRETGRHSCPFQWLYLNGIQTVRLNWPVRPNSDTVQTYTDTGSFTTIIYYFDCRCFLVGQLSTNKPS